MHSPEAPEEVSVGHFQHTGHHAALHAAGDHHAANRRSGGGGHLHSEIRVFVVSFAAITPSNGGLHRFEHDLHDDDVILHFHNGVVHGIAGNRSVFEQSLKTHAISDGDFPMK